MSVIHVLADGTRATDISGHVVKFEFASTVYQLMTRITNQDINSKKERNKKESEEV